MQKTLCYAIILWCCTGTLHANPDSLLNVAIEKATKLFNSDPQEALRMLQMAVKSPEFAASGCAARSLLYHRTGVCHFRLKSYREALSYFRDFALPLRTACLGKNHVETANTTYNVAMMFHNMGDKQSEADYLRRSIEILESLPTTPTGDNYLSRNYKEAAELCRNQGDYATAKRYLAGSKTLMEKSGTFQGQGKGIWLYRRGTLHTDMKEYAEATDAFRQAAAVYQQTDSVAFRVEIGNCSHELGRVCYFTKDFASAESYCRKGMAIYAKTPGEEINLSASYELLGNIQKQRKTYQAALKSFETSLSLRKKMGDNRLIANTWENLGDVYVALGQITKGLSCYQKGADSPRKTDIIRAGLLRAAALRKIGVEKKDKTVLEESLNLYVQIDSIATDLRLFFQDPESKKTLLSENQPFYESAIKTAYLLYQFTQNQQYIEIAYRFCSKNKAAILMEAVSDLEAKSLGLPDSLLVRERSMRLRCQQLLSAGNPEFDIERLRYQHFMQQLEQQYPNYFRLKHQLSKMTVSAAQMQAALAANAAIIEYFTGKNNLYIFLITSKTSLVLFEQTIPPNFEETCRQFRALAESIDDNNKLASYPQLANILYQTILLQPLQVVPATVESICVVPDGMIANLPFDILPTENVPAWQGAQTPFLLKRFALSQAFSTQWLFYQHQHSKRTDTWLKIFGGFGLEYDDLTLKALTASGIPTDTNIFKRNVGKLYFSDDEVRESAALLGGDAWLNQIATKNRFLQSLGAYQILHLAMHGLLDSKSPGQSALVFSLTAAEPDFKLYLAEIFGLQIPAQLAVLSACNTYDGPSVPGEGLNSLALAFAHAGCPAIIANQWSASDQSSKDLVIRFYRYLKQGLSKDKALQQAKLDYIKESMPTFGQPSYWANLILIGDTVPMLLSDPTIANESAPSSYKPLLLLLLIVLIAAVCYFFLYGRGSK